MEAVESLAVIGETVGKDASLSFKRTLGIGDRRKGQAVTFDPRTRWRVAVALRSQGFCARSPAAARSFNNDRQESDEAIHGGYLTYIAAVTRCPSAFYLLAHR